MVTIGVHDPEYMGRMLAFGVQTDLRPRENEGTGYPMLLAHTLRGSPYIVAAYARGCRHSSRAGTRGLKHRALLHHKQ